MGNTGITLHLRPDCVNNTQKVAQSTQSCRFYIPKQPGSYAAKAANQQPRGQYMELTNLLWKAVNPLLLFSGAFFLMSLGSPPAFWVSLFCFGLAAIAAALAVVIDVLR